MERADQRFVMRIAVLKDLGDSLVHLFGSFVGEGYGNDPVGSHSVLDEIGKTVRQSPGFSGARTGDYSQVFGIACSRKILLLI